MPPAPTPKSPRDVVIVSTVRTPLCRARKGALVKIAPSTLLSTALKGCFSKLPSPNLQPSDVEDVCVGNVLCPVNAVVARMAQISSGIPYTTPLSTTNRQCSSGLQAVANIANAITAGQIDSWECKSVDRWCCCCFAHDEGRSRKEIFAYIGSLAFVCGQGCTTEYYGNWTCCCYSSGLCKGRCES